MSRCQHRRRDEPDGDYVEFCPAGASVKGEFHCAECGYGVTVTARCPSARCAAASRGSRARGARSAARAASCSSARV